VRRTPHPRDPWRRAPVGELQEQLLPRWFVILCVALVPVAIAAVIAGFLLFGPRDVPVAARRPPPADGFTSDVGEYVVGATDPQVYGDACPMLEGVAIAGTEQDRTALRLGLSALCNTSLTEELEAQINSFAQAQGVVRFAQFQSTGVDSTARPDDQPPVILINAKFQRTDPLWIAPLIAHDAVFMTADPATAAGALEARRAEDLVCDRILGGRRESRGCADAEELLALPDPESALREAGFR
jgi:hypothetical protein